MKDLPKSSPGWQGCFWIGVFAALAAVGLPRVGRSDPYLPLADHGPDSSVNATLSSALKEDQLAEPLMTWLTSLPKGKPVLVVAQPGNSSAVFVADIISYLGWPRRVEILTAPKDADLKIPRSLDSYCAVGWIRLQPPPTKYGKSFGRLLTFTSSEPLPE